MCECEATPCGAKAVQKKKPEEIQEQRKKVKGINLLVRWVPVPIFPLGLATYRGNSTDDRAHFIFRQSI